MLKSHKLASLILINFILILLLYTIKTESSNQASEYKSSLSARYFHTAVWTGKDIIIWGGRNHNTKLNDGAIYNLTTKKWQEINLIGAPDARSNHCAIWTGKEMIIWGGETDSGITNTGAKYDPQKNKWILMSDKNAPLARTIFTAIWTGSKMIVWGGISSDSVLNDGGIYDPENDTWKPLPKENAPIARHWHSAVWDGKRMIVWGGNDGLTNKFLNDGAVYDPSINTWKPISMKNAPEGRAKHLALFLDNFGMLIWGGYNSNNTLLNNGAIYDPHKNTWKTITIKNAPSSRQMHTLQGIWTGSYVIIWGGLSINGYSNDGAIYDPKTDKWTPLPTLNTMQGRDMHSVIWTSKELIIWGGWNKDGSLNDGFSYNPSMRKWTPLP